MITDPTFWATLLLAIAGSSALSTGIHVVAARRKTAADTATTLVSTATLLVAPLRERIASLEADLAEERQMREQLETELRHEISELRAQRDRMLGLIHDHDLEWPPPDWAT